MADEHLFTADVEGPRVPTDGRGRWQSCLIGCLLVFVVLLVIAVLIGFWIARNWRDWTATGAGELVRQAMAESQLPPQEQQEIMVQVDRVGQAFRDHAISAEQFAQLAQKLVESPVMSLAAASMIDRHYFANSGLSEEEKTAGRQTLQRFIRGAIDKQIDQEGIDAAMKHIADRDARGEWKLRERPTDDELRAFLAEASQQADAAGVAEQPAEIDPSEEIKRIVDEALQAPA